MQWSQGPRSSPRWRGRAQSEKSNCRQKRSGSVSTVQWLSSGTSKESAKERGVEWEGGTGRRAGELGRPSYPRHGSLPHAFRSQGTSRGQLGKRDYIEKLCKVLGCKYFQMLKKQEDWCLVRGGGIFGETSDLWEGVELCGRLIITKHRHYRIIIIIIINMIIISII